MIWCPGPEALIGVEVHGVDVLPPLDLLQSHGGLVGGEDGGWETEPPVNGQSVNETSMVWYSDFCNSGINFKLSFNPISAHFFSTCFFILYERRQVDKLNFME